MLAWNRRHAALPLLLSILLFAIACANDDDDDQGDIALPDDDDDNGDVDDAGANDDLDDDDDDIADDDDNDSDDDDDDDCDLLFPDLLIVAHRGATAYAPGNTLPAIEKTFEIGADFVEIDVRHTADGHYVLMHNDTVDATTNGTGYVSEMTLAEIKELLVDDSAYGNIHGDLRVPTLEEALLVIAEKDGQAYLDMKTTEVGGAVQVVVDLGLEDRALAYCGDLHQYDQVRTVSTQIRISPSSTFTFGTRFLFLRFEPDPEIIDVHDLGLNKRNIELIHSKGALVVTDALGSLDDLAMQGYTKAWRILMEWGVDIIQTDYPEELIEYRDSLCQ